MRATKKLALVAAVAACLTISAGAAVGSAPANQNYKPLPHAEVHEITSVSAKTLKDVGAGSWHGSRNTPPGLVKIAKLAAHGKPELAYILGEFCPYCAGESWSVAVALSRFGTFRGLTTLTSTAQDVPASIQTISFRYSHFTSRYLAYDPIVNEDVNLKHVDSVPPVVRRAWHRYGPDGYPFMDFGGVAILDASSFNPKLLAKLTRKQIAADLNHPTQRVAKAVDGTANQLTAAICIMTKEKPAKVCKTKTISAIRRSLRPLRKSTVFLRLR